MTKRALSAVAGFLGLCLSVPAQAQSPAPFGFDGSTLDRPFVRLPPLSLADHERLSFSTAFNWQTPVEILPTFDPAGPQSFAYPTTPSRRNSFDRAAEMRAPDRVYVGGEIGFLYGKSSGKYGREDFQSYIIGTVGNDKFSITAGFLHQESSGRVPRWGR
jgi:hypothetical protein